MQALTEHEHREALIRRRVRFIVTYPAIARLLRKGMRDHVETELVGRVRPERLTRLQTQWDYEHWLKQTVEHPCWKKGTRWPLDAMRWAFIAKLLNIVIYEIVTHRELFAEADWQRLRPWLHVPIDRIVLRHLRQLDPHFPRWPVLKGMTHADYQHIQATIRSLAARSGVPPIWFEAAWSAERVMKSEHHDHKSSV